MARHFAIHEIIEDHKIRTLEHIETLKDTPRSDVLRDQRVLIWTHWVKTYA